MGHVVIGMDPHKRSATIEIIDERQQVLSAGRFGTDRDGYRAMLAAGRKFKDRVWAVEGCNGSAATSRSAWSLMASRSSMCQRSCLPGPARSLPARDAKPIRPVRIRWRWPGCTARACG